MKIEFGRGQCKLVATRVLLIDIPNLLLLATGCWCSFLHCSLPGPGLLSRSPRYLHSTLHMGGWHWYCSFKYHRFPPDLHLPTSRYLGRRCNSHRDPYLGFSVSIVCIRRSTRGINHPFLENAAISLDNNKKLSWCWSYSHVRPDFSI